MTLAATVGLAVATTAALVLTGVARRLAFAVGFFDLPGAHKSHHKPVPYFGGLAIAVSTFIGLLAACIAGFVEDPKITSIVIGAAVMCVLGLADDNKGLRPHTRLLFQAAAAFGVVLAGTRLDATGMAAMDVVLTVVWIMAVTNALNFADNMDGLAAGFGAVGGLSIAIIGWSSSPAVAVLGIAVGGACLGFLPWNRTPARIYMGDTGSLFIGFVLATATIEIAA